MNFAKFGEPPYTERYVRWWCAAKAAPKMEVGPPTGTGQADLLNNLLLQSKAMVVSNEGKVHIKWACGFYEDERK